MTTLAIATWHAKPQLLEEQILHYNASFDGDVTHLININADYKDSFWDEANNLGVNFSKYKNVIFFENPVRTYYAGVAHAFLIGVQEALRRKINFDYIYWHTSSDLLIKPGLGEFIRRFDIGFGKSNGVPFQYRKDHRGEVLPKFDIDSPSDWLTAISEHHQITPALQAMGMDRLHKSRCEGSFFSREVFFEMIYPLTSNISVKEMSSPPKPYPMEEYIFAQCVEFFCKRHEIRRTSHVVMTSRAPKNYATLEEIKLVISNSEQFGVKRFSIDLFSPERTFVRNNLGIRTPETLQNAK
jgi:hypothetical protein